MDAIAEFQRLLGPAVFRFIADYAAVIKFLIVAGCLIGSWLVADGLKSPRQVFDKLVKKGSSDGNGDIPRED